MKEARPSVAPSLRPGVTDPSGITHTHFILRGSTFIMASASGQVGGLQLQAGSSGGGFRIRAGGASHRGHQSGRAYDASSFDGAAFFECDELVGAGSKRKRKRRVLCVTASDVLTLVEVTERNGRGRGCLAGGE